MTIQEELDKQGYDVSKIYVMAEALIDDMLKIEPMPNGLVPKQYMVMGAAATAALILSNIDRELLNKNLKEKFG